MMKIGIQITYRDPLAAADPARRVVPGVQAHTERAPTAVAGAADRRN
jgi:hypothetical protein